MNGKTIIHVEFATGVHLYFGSIAAIYETFDASVLGVSKQRLYGFGITPEKPYRNKICTIRRGGIARKKGNRTNKMNSDTD